MNRLAVIGETFPYITTTSTGSQLSESLKQIDSGINIKCVTQRVTSQSVHVMSLSLGIQ